MGPSLWAELRLRRPAAYEIADDVGAGRCRAYEIADDAGTGRAAAYRIEAGAPKAFFSLTLTGSL